MKITSGVSIKGNGAICFDYPTLEDSEETARNEELARAANEDFRHYSSTSNKMCYNSIVNQIGIST